MTVKNDMERKALTRLADALVDDILKASDEEILTEFRETDGDSDRHASEMRDVFEKIMIVANKSRLVAARAAVVVSRRTAGSGNPPIDIAEARKRLRAVLNTPGAAQPLTMAARKESEMSDADILAFYDDLRELGALPLGDDEGTMS